MTIRGILNLAFFMLAAGTLAACTSFAPVYGERSGLGADALRFQFAEPDSRLEQLIYNRLKVAFPGEALAGDPVLDITATAGSTQGSMSNAFPVARPVTVRVDAKVSITSSDDEELFSATRFADTAYQSGKLTPVDLQSTSGAQETAAKSVAEALRLAILAGYRRP